MAWLSGWDKRIELAIGDYAGDIGAEVTWFPVTVFLTATQGEEVFVELTTDAEYLKVAFTKADGETELYAEKELFDVSEELGIFHVSRDGWTINANTSIYMYYDKDHADNTTYIGAINTTPGAAVWDSNFKFVCHMVDDAGGEIDDSTSNSFDGTKKGANEPAEATGIVGRGQEFDRSDDYISLPTYNNIGIATSVTIEAFVKGDGNLAEDDAIIASDVVALYPYKLGFLTGTGGNIKLRFLQSEGVGWDTLIDTSDLFATSDTNWHYMVATNDGSNAYVNVDTVQKGTDASPAGTLMSSTNIVTIGRYGSNYFGGVQDEIRLSNTARSTAWQKGTYNTLLDALFTYGSEESIEVEVNAIFFGANF